MIFGLFASHNGLDPTFPVRDTKPEIILERMGFTQASSHWTWNAQENPNVQSNAKIRCEMPHGLPSHGFLLLNPS